MKKLIALLLILATTFALSSCWKNNDGDGDNGGSQGGGNEGGGEENRGWMDPEGWT